MSEPSYLEGIPWRSPQQQAEAFRQQQQMIAQSPPIFAIGKISGV